MQPGHCSVVWLSVAVWKTKSVTACVENKCEEPWTNSSRHLLVVSTKEARRQKYLSLSHRKYHYNEVNLLYIGGLVAAEASGHLRHCF